MSAETVAARFRRRLVAGERLLGCFVKTPHPAVVEVLGGCGFDCLVLDAEHAPFDRAAVDACILAARAVGVAALVRVPEPSTAWIATVFDCGAAGIVVPHVASAAQAAALAQAVRYGPQGRGFSPSPRAAEYGARGVAGHLAAAGEETVLIAQIEDPVAAQAAAEIAAVPGVDALFVGPVDLGIACGLPVPSPELDALCRQVLAVGGPGRARTGIFVAGADGLAAWADSGASFFVTGSDQSLLRAGGMAAAGR